MKRLYRHQIYGSNKKCREVPFTWFLQTISLTVDYRRHPVFEIMWFTHTICCRDSIQQSHTAKRVETLVARACVRHNGNVLLLCISFAADIIFVFGFVCTLASEYLHSLLNATRKSRTKHNTIDTFEFCECECGGARYVLVSIDDCVTVFYLSVAGSRVRLTRRWNLL